MARVRSYINPKFSRLIVMVWVCHFWSSIIIKAQEPHDRLMIENLRQKYTITTDPLERTYILDDYCLYYQIKDYKVDSVIFYGHKILEIAETEDFPIAAVVGHRRLGSQYRRINKFEDAKYHLYTSMSLADQIGYKKYIHDVYSSLAYVFLKESKLDSALFYYKKCLDETPKELNSKYSNYHLGISDVYEKLGRLDKQEEHLILSYDYSIKANIKLDKFIAVGNLVHFYSAVAPDPIQFNKYKKFYDKIMASYESGDYNSHYNYSLPEDVPINEAIAFYEASIEDDKKTQYYQGVYMGSRRLQELLLLNNRYKECLEHIEEMLHFGNESGTLTLAAQVNIYKNKWKAESHLDNPTKAFKTVEYYQTIKDSLRSKINAENVNELSEKYESAKKDAQITQIVAENNKRTEQRNYAIFASMFFLGLGIFLWSRSKSKQRESEAKEKLQTEKISNLEKEKEILSLTSMIEGQEVERKRIAQDLHDGLGGLLASVRNHFSLIDIQVKKLDKLNIYDRTNTMIDQACREVRRISHNLMPASLELNGLIHTVQDYCQDVENSSALNIHFEYTGVPDVNLEDTKEIFLYRIIQEAVNNVIKHADARSLFVQLGCYEKEISLIIEDDGKGFDLDSKKSGIGLQSIISRVNHLKGHIDIDSKINQGTTITINIPHE